MVQFPSLKSSVEIDFVRVYERILPPDTSTTTRPIMTQQRHPLPRIPWFRSIQPSNGYLRSINLIIQSVEIFDVYGQKVAYFETWIPCRSGYDTTQRLIHCQSQTSRG